MDTPAMQAMLAFFHRCPRLFILTGAGCSTASGIPDYRGEDGGWKRPPPVTYQAFMGDEDVRKRYWARSMIGWRVMGQAAPGPAHHALSALESLGRVEMLLTQNVDGLHGAAGQKRVIDLHGRIDTVRCMACDERMPRADLQDWLVGRNPGWASLDAAAAPDGDADLEGHAFSAFQVPVCPSCGGGPLKPDVVFFGESVPRARVAAAQEALGVSDGMLVAGSSLMVYSGFRFVQAAVDAGLPVVAINRGVTRADPLLHAKLQDDVGIALSAIVQALSA
ncbi:NAD-dependent protein deacetylase [Acidovorax sp. NCPPB 4044]|uniref:NAD-dependent protein deacetylase n=1 Tax=Acidovorax sp. NCPPB 4044 TaxID=2940490 RepID=UPI00230452B5|nr:NAD-dependent protein deacetylase [Acidovorax sp. NCPPB 4044]MDA8520618.1 NAD-dependent protein deacetylase [Acidovorax sp. NCPPB 4044]